MLFQHLGSSQNRIFIFICDVISDNAAILATLLVRYFYFVGIIYDGNL